MTPFTIERGRAVDLGLENVDTDQLIPARFMSRSRAEGYGDLLFHDLRRDDSGALRADFPLNRIAGAAPFLIAGENFGCGSSREAAVYVLQDAGFRAVIATGYADIFCSNAMKNGLLPVELAPADHAALRAAIAQASESDLVVDLARQSVTHRAGEWAFEIAPGSKRMLLAGLDEIADTLQDHAAIAEFEQVHFTDRPWIRPPTAS